MEGPASSDARPDCVGAPKKYFGGRSCVSSGAGRVVVLDAEVLGKVRRKAKCAAWQRERQQTATARCTADPADASVEAVGAPRAAADGTRVLAR